MKKLETGNIGTGNTSTLATIGRLFIAVPISLPGFTHLKKKMREGNGVWLEEIQRP
jgi:hypothetical protein